MYKYWWSNSAFAHKPVSPPAAVELILIYTLVNEIPEIFFFPWNPYLAGFHCENGKTVYFTSHFHISLAKHLPLPFCVSKHLLSENNLFCCSQNQWKPDFQLVLCRFVLTTRLDQRGWVGVRVLTGTLIPPAHTPTLQHFTPDQTNTLRSKWKGSPATPSSVKRDFLWKHSLQLPYPGFYKTCLYSSPPFPEPFKDTEMESSFKSNLVTVSMLVLLPRGGYVDYTLVTYLTKERVILPEEL